MLDTSTCFKVLGDVGTWWCDRCNDRMGKQSHFEIVELPFGVRVYRCKSCGSCVCPHCYDPIDRWYDGSANKKNSI